jgi:hypothetical protein
MKRSSKKSNRAWIIDAPMIGAGSLAAALRQPESIVIS